MANFTLTLRGCRHTSLLTFLFLSVLPVVLFTSSRLSEPHIVSKAAEHISTDLEGGLDSRCNRRLQAAACPVATRANLYSKRELGKVISQKESEGIRDEEEGLGVEVEFTGKSNRIENVSENPSCSALGESSNGI